ncbi:MAG: 3-oxoacyl-ACP synthase III [Planctomycetota bacterium]|nr:MAG: 3-oxoacyl-ACP synthase III [Planctomycetota bacterium]
MRYRRVCVEVIRYELPPTVVTSAMLEERLAPVYDALRIPHGQIEALTGVRERRWWAPGQTMAAAAAAAGRKALDACDIPRDAIGMLIYGGVCRDHVEPATACAVADALDLPGQTELYDVSNACLGVLNGVVQIANAIELGQVRAGLAVSAETARPIVEQTIARLTANPTMDVFKTSLATLTGGSGAVAVVVVHEDLARHGHRLLGGVARSEAQHHRLCWWGGEGDGDAAPMLHTHAVELLEAGVALGARTWSDFREALQWDDLPDRVVCHQVGRANRDAILRALEIPPERDFATFPFLGNIGTVSLPITAAIAEQRGVIEPGQRVGWLGIASGLNCLMLGLDW